MYQKKKIEHWEMVTLLSIVYDFLAIIMLYFTALWILFDCNGSGEQNEAGADREFMRQI